MANLRRFRSVNGRQAGTEAATRVAYAATRRRRASDLLFLRPQFAEPAIIA